MNRFHPDRREAALLFILACIQFTHILDFMIIMPLGPQLIRIFAIEPSSFGLIVSSYTFSAGVSGFISALFIDKFDRKTFLLLTYTGFLIGTLFCGLANSFITLLLARIVAGGFGGLINACIFAMIGDKIPYERRGKATGVIMSAFSLASVLGVPIGLYLASHIHWRFPFYMLSALSLVFLISTFFYLPPFRDHIQRNLVHVQHPLRTLLAIFRNHNHLWSFSLIMLMMMAGFTVIPYIAPYLVFNAGLSEQNLSYIYLLGGATTLFTARIIGKSADKFGKAFVFRIIAAISMLPILAITHIGRVPTLYILTITTFFFIFVSGRMVPAMAMITSSVHPENRGGFMSINSALQQIAAGLASLYSGLVLQKTDTGQLQNYDLVGYTACLFTILCILISNKLKVSS